MCSADLVKMEACVLKRFETFIALGVGHTEQYDEVAIGDLPAEFFIDHRHARLSLGKHPG